MLNSTRNIQNNIKFNCFKHPNKHVEAICTDPVCNHYRFFCVTCFLEHSSHFINHKNQIYDIQEYLSTHQNSLVRTAGVSEIDSMIMQIKQNMKEYEVLITQKSLGYSKVFQEIEKKFEEAKQNCLKEVQEYLQILVQKQQAHYTYLKKKVDMYKSELNGTDISHLNNGSESEITFFFENIIKNQYNSHKEFKQEVKMYTNSFQKNIFDLDNVDSSKVVEMCMEDMKQQFKEKFSELKEILIVPNEEHLSFLKNSKIKTEQQNNYYQEKQQQQNLFEQNQISKNNMIYINTSNNLYNSDAKQVKNPLFHNNQYNSINKSNNNNMNKSNVNNNKQHFSVVNSNQNNNSSNLNLFQQKVNNYQQNQEAAINSDYIEDSASAYNKKIQEKQAPNYINSNLNYFQSSLNTLATQVPPNNPYMENFQKPMPKKQKKQQNTQSKVNNNFIVLQNNDSEIEIESENENDNEQLQINKQKVINNYTYGKSSSKIYQASKNQSIAGTQNKQNEEKTNFTHTEGISCILQYDQIEDKKIIATGSLDNSIRLWNIGKNSFDHLKTLQGHKYSVTCMIKFERDGINFIASGDSNHEIKIWNPSLPGKELITTLLGHYEGGITTLYYAFDYLISASQDYTIRIWSLNDLKCIQTIKLDQYSSCLSSYSDLLIATSYEGFRIYQFINDIENGVIFKLKSYNNKAHRPGISKIIEINSDGIDLATSGKDGLIKLWNMEQAGCVRQLKGHTDCVYDMVFMNDKLFTSGRDGLKIWTLDGDCILERNNNHKFVRDDILGQVVIIQEYDCALSVGNGDNIIKIIPF